MALIELRKLGKIYDLGEVKVDGAQGRHHSTSIKESSSR